MIIKPTYELVTKHNGARRHTIHLLVEHQGEPYPEPSFDLERAKYIGADHPKGQRDSILHTWEYQGPPRLLGLSGTFKIGDYYEKQVWFVPVVAHNAFKGLMLVESEIDFLQAMHDFENMHRNRTRQAAQSSNAGRMNEIEAILRKELYIEDFAQNNDKNNTPQLHEEVSSRYHLLMEELRGCCGSIPVLNASVYRIRKSVNGNHPNRNKDWKELPYGTSRRLSRTRSGYRGNCMVEVVPDDDNRAEILDWRRDQIAMFRGDPDHEIQWKHPRLKRETRNLWGHETEVSYLEDEVGLLTIEEPAPTATMKDVERAMEEGTEKVAEENEKATQAPDSKTVEEALSGPVDMTECVKDATEWLTKEAADHYMKMRQKEGEKKLLLRISKAAEELVKTSEEERGERYEKSWEDGWGPIHRHKTPDELDRFWRRLEKDLRKEAYDSRQDTGRKNTAELTKKFIPIIQGRKRATKSDMESLVPQYKWNKNLWSRVVWFVDNVLG